MEGVVTLVDTNRQLVVLQDTSAAVALNIITGLGKVESGQIVRIDGTNCSPYFFAFPGLSVSTFRLGYSASV